MSEGSSQRTDGYAGLIRQAEQAIAAGRKRDARRHLQKAVRARPDEYRGWLLLAGVASTARASLDYLARAEVLRPDDPSVRLARSWAEQWLRSGSDVGKTPAIGQGNVGNKTLVARPYGAGRSRRPPASKQRGRWALATSLGSLLLATVIVAWWLAQGGFFAQPGLEAVAAARSHMDMASNAAINQLDVWMGLEPLPTAVPFAAIADYQPAQAADAPAPELPLTMAGDEVVETSETGESTLVPSDLVSESPTPTATAIANHVLPAVSPAEPLAAAGNEDTVAMSALLLTWTVTPLPTHTPTPTPTPTETPLPTATPIPPTAMAVQAAVPGSVAAGERWIDVNLSTQTLTAHEGNVPILTSLVSSGTWLHPTVTGEFRIYLKYESQDMNGYHLGYNYYLPGVPYVMYFYKDYGLHGTYWHNNFGTPMSHGCVNLPTENAGWLYFWADIGTLVSVHY